MLRITQQSSADAAKQYYTSAGMDYYSEGVEKVGRWGGEGATLLGLEGDVSHREFNRLCDNRDPLTGEQLTSRTRDDRTVGYDFTFSVPKSVSLLYAMTEDKAVLDAFRDAVQETMRDIEAEMKVRVRKKGRNEERVTGNLAYAEFVHFTSRPVDGVPDPQLHAHCFVFNTTWDEQEQAWKAGQFRDLKRDAPYWQAAFRARLANHLQDLGLAIERKRDDFEIAGVPASAIRRFSRRTDKIEEEARKRGIDDPEEKARLGGLTREKKDKSLTWKELQAEWNNRLTPEERQAIAAVHTRRGASVPRERRDTAAVDFALEHSFVREAVVPERKLLTEALKRGIGSVTVEGVQSELAKRPLLRLEHQGQQVATTEKALAAEERLIAFARDGRGCYRPLGDPERSFTREWLNEGQKAAVRHVLGSRDAVTIIRGVYGTGKTTLEQEIAEAVAETGRPVVAVAPTAAASDVLREEAGIATADTVARFLTDKRMQEAARFGIVMVDEAGMLGTEDMLRLFKTAESVRARVVLVGDRSQTRSVSAGEPLRLLEERAGLKVAEVTEILRQSGRYKDAAKALSEGKVADALDVLDKLGWVRELPDGERYQAMAEAYLKTAGEKKRGGKQKTVLAVSPTWAEAGRITVAIRDQLKGQGKLGEERVFDTWVPSHLTDAQKRDVANYEPGDVLVFHQNAPGYGNGARVLVAEEQKLPLQFAERFEVYRPVKLGVAVHDRLRVTRNGMSGDGRRRLRNGTLYSVQGFTPEGDLIVDGGRILPKSWGHFSLGYAVSAETSQGKTVDKVLVGLSSQSFGAANQRRFGVPVTRGKEQVLVFTDNKEAMLKAVQRADEPMSATELAELRARKLPGRERLTQHLSFMRRSASLFPAAKSDFGRTPLQREVSYGRE